MKNKHLLDVFGEIDDKYIEQAAPEENRTRRKSIWLKWGTIAACIAFLVLASVGSYVIVAEAKEYKAALRLFNDYGMSTEGLTRGEVKAVYRDITTKSFNYSKTDEVIRRSISSDYIGGYEITQDNPTPEDVQNLWNYKNFISGSSDFLQKAQKGIHYEYRSEYKEDENLGFTIFDKSYFEKYEEGTLLWSVSVPEFWINDYITLPDGVIIHGKTAGWSSDQISSAWMAKIDANGNLIWKCKLENGFDDEQIAEVYENVDGSYTVISRGDLKYFCLSQYTADGKQKYIKKTEVGNYGIWNCARFKDGYIVQLGSYLENEHAKIVKVDHEGNIAESFIYGDNNSYYYITDMIEFNNNIYLSAYAVPKLPDENQSADFRYEMKAVLSYVLDNELWDISDEELTPKVRDNYTAMLLVCEPSAGEPQEYYSVKGSLGGKLAVSEDGKLLWDVESIASTFFSPATSSFSIGGTSHLFRYTFDQSGMLISQEKTEETVVFRR